MTKPKYEALRDKKGMRLPCMHKGCYRDAVRVVAYEKPRHQQFKGQTHNCCAHHSKP